MLVTFKLTVTELAAVSVREICEVTVWPAFTVRGASIGPEAMGEVAFHGIIPSWFAVYSVNQKLPLGSSALRREYARPEVGIANSSIIPVAGSSRPTLFPKCSTNQNRPCLSMEIVAGAVVL